MEEIRAVGEMIIVVEAAAVDGIDQSCWRDHYSCLSEVQRLSMEEIRAVGDIIIVVEAAAVDGRDKSCW